MVRQSLGSMSKGEVIRRFQLARSASLGEMEQAVQQGVAAGEVEDLAALLGLPRARLSCALGIPHSTIRRKARNEEALRLDQGERVLGLQRLIGRIQTIVEEGGDATGFDAGAWAGRWLLSPQPALGGRLAIEFLGTVTGQQLLDDLLLRNLTGTYA